jgi:8-oxo-dGTP diphosphatase
MLTNSQINPDRHSRPQVILVNRAIVQNQQGQILLVQRADGDNWDPGKWEFPGGKLDQGQDISSALEREVFEETGLVVLPSSRIVYCESKLITVGKYEGLAYVILIGTATSQTTDVKLSSEHQDFKWVTVAGALDLDLALDTHKALLVLKDTVLKNASS